MEQSKEELIVLVDLFDKYAAHFEQFLFEFNSLDQDIDFDIVEARRLIALKIKMHKMSLDCKACELDKDRM